MKGKRERANSGVSSLVGLLKSRRFNYSTERDLQDGIDAVLEASGYRYEREKSLGGAGVIDFLIEGGVGVEVKIKGSPVEVARQLLRYAKEDAVTEIVLVTGRARLGKLPETLHGKPVTVVTMWESFL